MAHSLSAKKRIVQNEKRRIVNRARKNELKTMIRKLNDAIHESDFDGADKHYRDLTKRLDQVACTGALHKNAAARKKSRLAKRLNAAKAAKA